MSTLLKQAQQLLTAGRFSDAEQLCRRALETTGPVGLARKLLSECLYNQGVMLMYSGMGREARECFHAALSENPKHALAHNNLGVLAISTGQFNAAIEYFQGALSADPRLAMAMQSLATCYQRLDRLDDASNIFARLERIDPVNAGLYRIRNATLIKSIIPDPSYPDQVRSRMDTLLDDCLRLKQTCTHPEKLAAPYFYLSYHGKSNRELHSKIARAYLHVCPQLAWEAPHVMRDRGDASRIKIGILSANLYNHSIGHTTRGLVERLDRKQFEVIVIRVGRNPRDDIATAIDAAADVVATVSHDDVKQARESIAALELDILFYQDIGMEPFSYLLSFSRLAPVQVTSFGHPDTTGVPNMDYFISSDLYEPDNGQDHYSEKLVLAPNAGTLAYYYRPAAPESASARSEFGLNDGDNIYFCPQTLFKIHPDMDAAFAGVVRRDPKARLVFIEPSQTNLRLALESRFQGLSADIVNRIQFIKRLQHDQYLRLMACADVMLDTFHFNGQNTNLEAFSIGIPVVTWPGTMQRGRHTLGMYKKMGEELFSDLIADGAEDYAEKAVRVATDRAFRSELQARIAQCRTALYEDIEFVRSCEKLFIQMLRERSSLTSHS